MILRLIGQWLNAGVMEAGHWYRPERGSPTGGVISPLLANLYLHHVLDQWFAREVQPRLIGCSHLLRYADDAVLVFANEHDARRVQAVLAQRFARFGLTLHPIKTRLVHFRPPARGRRRESFDLLGFTHYWVRSRRGGWRIKRNPAKDRFRRGVKRISQWCRRNRHRPIREQHEALLRQLKGLYNYYGIRGNYRALARLCYCVERVWLKWLSRRSQRGWLNWAKAARLMRLYALPTPRIHRDVVA